MIAGLKVPGLIAGPPIVVSLKASAPILILGASQAVILRGYMSNGGMFPLEGVKLLYYCCRDKS
jgi:hypothetical protein